MSNMPKRNTRGSHARGAPRASRETLRYAVVSVALLAPVSNAFTQQQHNTLSFAKTRTSVSQPSFAIARASVVNPLFPRTLTTARSAVVPDLGSNLANDGADSEELSSEPPLSSGIEEDLEHPLESSAACVQQVLDNAVAFVEMPAWNLSSAPATDETMAPSHEDELNKSVATIAATPASDSTADDQTSSSSSSSPVGLDIVKMTLPLLAVWLSSPVLSVVDTAVVGRTAGMAELAALGPATALCDMGTYFFNFLSLVTTSRVAHALVAKDAQAAQKAVGDGVAVATVLGTLAAAALLSPLGPSVLSWFTSAGGGAEMATFFQSSLAYVRVRALGLVPALAGVVYQSACLARKDVTRPLAAVAFAALFNLLGDCVLVLGLKQGAVGAAWGTTAAQVVAWGVLARHEAKIYRKVNNKGDADALTAAMKAAEPSKAQAGVAAGTTIAGASLTANPAATAAPIGGAPPVARKVTAAASPGRSVAERAAGAKSFFAECGAPASALAGKSVVIMTLMATASGCGTVGLAAHQVLQSVNCLFTPVGEALSQTVQALLPAANSREQPTADNNKASVEGGAVKDVSKSGSSKRTVQKDSSNGSRRLTPNGRKLMFGMLLAAVGLGSVNAFLAGCIPIYGAAAFTSHAGVASMLSAAAPWMAVCLAFHALSTTLEGLLFASRDGVFLGRLYPVNSLAVCGVFYVLRMQQAALPALWQTMACYNVGRCLLFGSRLAFNQRAPPPPPTPALGMA